MPVDLGHRVLPCLLTSDMRRTLDFYIDVLGFTQTGYYPIESEPIRTEVRRDDVAIIFFTEAYHNVGEIAGVERRAVFLSGERRQRWPTSCTARCRSSGDRRNRSWESANLRFAIRTAICWCLPSRREFDGRCVSASKLRTHRRQYRVDCASGSRKLDPP